VLTRLPPAAGIGLKADYFRDVFEAAASTDGLWVEVHAENYMVDGGPRLAWLEVIREEIPVSLHGVGLSIAGPGPLDEEHLARWRALASRIEPAAVSEHLAWSVHHGQYHADLFPALLTEETLERACSNIARMQDVLDRSVMIENPANYADLRHEMDEADFLNELVRRTGCGLLLDLNNLAVTRNNIARSPEDFLSRINAAAIGEIHIAGALPDPADPSLIIDSHDAPVSDEVWALLDDALSRFGPRPVLLERDSRLPPFKTLMKERTKAQAALENAAPALTAAL